MGPLFVAAIAFWPAVFGTGFYFVRRYIRAVERRAGSEVVLATLSERLLRVEEALEATRTELSRLEEGHEFTQRLLAERSSNRGQAT
jgi:hypothetical protein